MSDAAETVREALNALSEASEGWPENNLYILAYREAWPALDRLLSERETAEWALDEARTDVGTWEDIATRRGAEAARLREALLGCRDLFTELRSDWSDNRGPCREGFAIIDAALSGGSDE